MEVIGIFDAEVAAIELDTMLLEVTVDEGIEPTDC